MLQRTPRHERVDVRLSKARLKRMSSRPDPPCLPAPGGSRPLWHTPTVCWLKLASSSRGLGCAGLEASPPTTCMSPNFSCSLYGAWLHGAWKAAALTSRDTMPVCRPSVQGEAHTRVSSRPVWDSACQPGVRAPPVAYTAWPRPADPRCETRGRRATPAGARGHCRAGARRRCARGSWH